MEGDAGPGRLNPTDADETPDESSAVSAQPTEEAATMGLLDPVGAELARTECTDRSDGRRPSRIGRAPAAAICAALVVLAAAGTAGGYLALRSHHQSEDITRAENAAVQAAKDCVAATHAPDTAAMSAAQVKIIECSTGDFGAQASLYGGVLVDAYRAANVTVKVSDIRAAVERRNADGSFEVLVAVRVKVTNSETADQEQGYRLRLQMAPDEGAYKVARLDQVTSS